MNVTTLNATDAAPFLAGRRPFDLIGLYDDGACRQYRVLGVICFGRMPQGRLARVIAMGGPALCIEHLAGEPPAGDNLHHACQLMGRLRHIERYAAYVETDEERAVYQSAGWLYLGVERERHVYVTSVGRGRKGWLARLGAIIKPAEVTKPNQTWRNGRPPINSVAMTQTERNRRYKAKLRAKMDGPGRSRSKRPGATSLHGHRLRSLYRAPSLL